jgi:hypothetical protein
MPKSSTNSKLPSIKSDPISRRYRTFGTTIFSANAPASLRAASSTRYTRRHHCPAVLARRDQLPIRKSNLSIIQLVSILRPYFANEYHWQSDWFFDGLAIIWERRGRQDDGRAKAWSHSVKFSIGATFNELIRRN